MKWRKQLLLAWNNTVSRSAKPFTKSQACFHIYLVKQSTIDENDSEEGMKDDDSSDVSVNVKSKKAGSVAINSPYAMFSSTHEHHIRAMGTWPG